MKSDYFAKSPPIVRDFLMYLETVKARSPKTVSEYFIDLRVFFRFIKVKFDLVDPKLAKDKFNEIDFLDIDLDLIKRITLADIYDFLHFASNNRKNEAAARSRKASTLRTFFDYLYNKVHLIDSNPTDQLEMPNKKKTLPKFLSLEQSIDLLTSIDGKYKERDYCIITLFINCGMRLSELVGINIADIQGTTIRLLGKGNKERIVYLNTACINAISDYLKVRSKDCKEIKDKKALFIGRSGTRLANRRVEQIVEYCLEKAGLDNMGFSPHKLRHTAATMMYQHGDVDIRILQEILGHSNLGTTEIYTHISSKQLEKASKSTPLSNFKKKEFEVTDDILNHTKQEEDK